MQFTIIQASDLHLSGSHQFNVPAWRSCVSYINTTNPRLVVLSGDIVLEDPDREEDYGFALKEVRQVKPEWRAIPGNHDIGESSSAMTNGLVTDERIARFNRYFGADVWISDIGRWRIIGVNDMAMAAPLARAGEYRRWLINAIEDAGGRPIAIFLHKPIFLDTLLEQQDDIWTTPPELRAWFRQVLSEHPEIRLISSGHAHHHKSCFFDQRLFVWAPSTSQVAVRNEYPYVALRKPGVVRFDFKDEDFHSTLVQPDGVGPADLTDLFARYKSILRAPGYTAP